MYMFLRMISFIVFVLLINFSCGGDKKTATKLTVVSYGGGAYQESHQKAFCTPFSEIISSTVDSVTWNAEYGKLKTMVDSGSIDWDVVDVTAAQFARGQKEGLFAKLEITPQSCNFLPNSISEYGVANVYWATVLAYKKSAFPTSPPKTWRDFWDVKKYPGNRALYDDPRGALEFALLADGVTIDKLYPLDVDRAFKKLDEIKPFIRVWWSDGTQPVQMLLNDTIVMSSAWNGRIFAVEQARNEIGYSWEGAAQELDYWVIPKGSKNEKLASMFILFASQPKVLAKQAEIVGYGPANQEALNFVNENIKPDLPTYEPNWKVSFVVNADWWSENEERVKARWLSWKGK